jgi:tetratricopeptide (TPR) repeat protein
MYFNKKEYKEAFLAYGKQIEIKPFKEAYYNAALAAFKAAQFPVAIEYFTDALKWDESYEDALMMRSKSYYQSCDYENAVADATTLVQKKQNEASFFWCGYLHLKYSEMEHAEKDFNAVLSLNPNNEEAKKYVAQCKYITEKFTIAHPKIKELLDNLSNGEGNIENYYISFTAGDVLHEGLLVKNQSVALLRIRYKGHCGDTKITQQTMLLEKGSTGLEMIGLAPVNAETLKPEPFYNTDNFYFDNTAFPPQLWNISENVKVAVNFKKLVTTDEILEGYKMVGLSNDK